MNKRTILVQPSCFAPKFEMTVLIPSDRDAEEYIDELLDGILNEDIKYNIEWEFVGETRPTVERDNHCASTGIICSFCQPGPCEHRVENM